MVGAANAVAKIDLRFPALLTEEGAIHEFTWGAVWFGSVENEFAFEANNFADGFGELADGDVVSVADIDQVGRVGFFQKESAGAGEVVIMQKLAARCTAAPDADGSIAAFISFVDFSHESGEDMGSLQVEIVARAVHIGGHGAGKIGSILFAIGHAELDAGNFGNGVGFVRWLQWAC